MAGIFVAASLLFLAPAAAVGAEGTLADSVGLLQHQSDIAAASAMRRDDLGSDAVDAGPPALSTGLPSMSLLTRDRSSRVSGNASSEDCSARPPSQACLDKIICPVLAGLVQKGCVNDPMKATAADLIQALQACGGLSDESSFLVTMDAAFLGDLNLFDLPPNHIGNTGIRRPKGLSRDLKARVDPAAFESMWKDFHSVKDGAFGTGQEVMCTEDLMKAADVFRQEASALDPQLDFKAKADWRNTVYGEPQGRDIMPLTMIALPIIFGEIYGETDCLDYQGLRNIFVMGKFPDKPIVAKGVARFIKAAQTTGVVANAKWHIPYIRTEFRRRQFEGKIPPDALFSDRALLVMWIA